MASVADARVGGTYMTTLTTFSNLGRKIWKKKLCQYFGDFKCVYFVVF